MAYGTSGLSAPWLLMKEFSSSLDSVFHKEPLVLLLIVCGLNVAGHLLNCPVKEETEKARHSPASSMLTSP